MLKLTLLRHAKSSWDDPKLSDFDRPLARRGIKSAPAMGAALKKAGVAPDLVLCSTSLRTKETWALASSELGGAPEVMFDDALYHAHADALLARLRGVDDRFRHVMVVAHHPGLQDFARDLVSEGSEKHVEALHAKFPTAAAAHIALGTQKWADLKWGDGRLEHFLTPKTI